MLPISRHSINTVTDFCLFVNAALITGVLESYDRITAAGKLECTWEGSHFKGPQGVFLK